MKVTLVFCLALFAGAAPTFAQTSEPSVAFGTKHAVALRTNGDVVTWGDNVFCQLGRPAGNGNGTPGLVLRNIKEIAASASHSLALSTDGKVYVWGGSDRGALGMGDDNEQCEGPVEVTTLEGKTIAHIATGAMFSVAITDSGDLYCTGENDMGQCPPSGRGTSNRFALVNIPELAGKVVGVRAGAFHVLAETRDGKFYALGRGRDGQLGNGRVVNGFTLVPDMADVVSFSAGTWHSVAARSDGSVWVWGNNSRSQLCDGTTTNRAVPTRVELPAGVKVTHVAAGGWATLMRTSDGTVYACGDNQFGSLGSDKPAVVSKPTSIATGANPAALATNGEASAYSTDGCAVRMGGTNDSSLVNTSASSGTQVFAVRAGLSLCGARPATPLATMVRVPPRGGASGCWTPRVEEDASTSPRWAPLRQAMLAAEELLKKNAAYVATPVPVRFRTSLSAGPGDHGTARMHVKAVPERKSDGSRLWTTAPCGVIPQVDRIGGAIGQISVFFNEDARGQFIGSTGQGPKQTGTVAGYPEYNGWVLITKDGGVPWIPQTLGERIELEGKRRRDALAEWRKDRENIKAMDPAAIEKTYQMLRTSDAAGAEKFRTEMKAQADEVVRLQRDVYPATTAALEKQVADYERYLASFTADELRAPAVLGDITGAGKRRLDAEIAALQALTPDEQRQIDAWARESGALNRQAQAAAAARNQEEAAGLRAQANELGVRARTLRQRHMERASPLMSDARARYDLENLRPGSADKAIAFKSNPALPNYADPNRIQVIAISFSFDPDPKQVERRAWQQRIKETFDFAALAAMLR